MKNIFMTSKRSIAAILTLCILLGIAGTCVHAASAMPEENPTATEETNVATEENPQELVPVTVVRCGPTFGLGECTGEEGEMPDPSGHNKYGSCTYIAYMDLRN